MSVKAAATHIDWTKLTTSLGLKTETVAALGAFRKRNEEARRVLGDLQEQKTAVDFAHYRKILKNQAVVDDLEKAFKSFKPASYDVQAQIKSIDAVEAKAVRFFFFSLPLNSHSPTFQLSQRLSPHPSADISIPRTSIFDQRRQGDRTRSIIHWRETGVEEFRQDLPDWKETLFYWRHWPTTHSLRISSGVPITPNSISRIQNYPAAHSLIHLFPPFIFSLSFH